MNTHRSFPSAKDIFVAPFPLILIENEIRCYIIKRDTFGNTNLYDLPSRIHWRGRGRG